MFKEGAMKEIAKYADGVGPGWYMLIDDKNSKVGNIIYTPMVKDIATTKMELHPYTVRKMLYLNSLQMLIKCMMLY